MQRLFEPNTAFALLLSQVMALTLFACTETKQKTDLNAVQELGRHLFFEPRLSLSHTRSCASCHDPLLAFTDGYRRSVSPQGENLQHNAPSLLNTASFRYYDWANPKATSYLLQIQRPLYGRQPVELGVDQHWDELKTFLAEDENYHALISKAFDESPSDFTQNKLQLALTAYLQTLQSMNSPYDRFQHGDSTALSRQAKRGLQLFESTELACRQCHPPPYFTLAVQSSNPAEVYVNIGLNHVTSQIQSPSHDPGLYLHTKYEEDQGKFRIPSLRNVGITSPYMHDGSFGTLGEVIDHYARGGGMLTSSADVGDGDVNSRKHPLIHGFTISDEDKQALLAFLHALTDTSYLREERFLNPFRDKMDSIPSD